MKLKMRLRIHRFVYLCVYFAHIYVNIWILISLLAWLSVFMALYAKTQVNYLNALGNQKDQCHTSQPHSTIIHQNRLDYDFNHTFLFKVTLIKCAQTMKLNGCCRFMLLFQFNQPTAIASMAMVTSLIGCSVFLFFLSKFGSAKHD